MPVLPDTQRERFAQEIAKGNSQTDAYKLAGYKGGRSAASRLAANVNVKARVEELTEKSAAKAISAISFEARDMFADLAEDIRKAAEAGDHKAAIDGRKFMLRCFGYEDSPTLTHEHVKGEKLAHGGTQSPADGDADSLATSAPASNVTRFPEVLRAIKKLERKV